MSHKRSIQVIAYHTTVPLADEWLEVLLCEECQQNEWYWVTQSENHAYTLSRILEDWWQQVQGVILPTGVVHLYKG